MVRLKADLIEKVDSLRDGAHPPQHRSDLTPVARGMIHDVIQLFPQGIPPDLALQIRVLHNLSKLFGGQTFEKRKALGGNSTDRMSRMVSCRWRTNPDWGSS